MANTPPSGKGSRTKPVALGPPVLIPNLSDHDREAAIGALTDILTAYWSRSKPLRTGKTPDLNHDRWVRRALTCR